MSLTLPRDWWGYHWSPPRPLSIVELIRAGTLDAELAALLWLLVEARVPLVVAARPPLAGKSTILTALLDFLPPEAEPVVLRGRYETFDWLPEAAELGWLGPVPAVTGPLAAPARVVEASPARCYLLASELSNHLPSYTWGAQARVAVRATSLGYGLGTTIHADSLAEVLSQLQAPAIGLELDELRSLGVVLVVRMFGADGALLEPGHGSLEVETAPLERGVARRIVAAHYIRPLERDAGGHVQRRPPAVLATRNAATDALDHFAWGVAPELAARVGRSAGEFEIEQRARAELLAELSEARPVRHADVGDAIREYRARRILRVHPVQPRPAPGPPGVQPAPPKLGRAVPLPTEPS